MFKLADMFMLQIDQLLTPVLCPDLHHLGNKRQLSVIVKLSIHFKKIRQECFILP